MASQIPMWFIIRGQRINLSISNSFVHQILTFIAFILFQYLKLTLTIGCALDGQVLPVSLRQSRWRLRFLKWFPSMFQLFHETSVGFRQKPCLEMGVNVLKMYGPRTSIVFVPLIYFTIFYRLLNSSYLNFSQSHLFSSWQKILPEGPRWAQWQQLTLYLARIFQKNHRPCQRDLYMLLPELERLLRVEYSNLQGYSYLDKMHLACNMRRSKDD